MGAFHVKVELPIISAPDEDGGFVVSCPPLSIASQGETREEALANFKEAASLFFEGCLEMGTLREVMEGSGFTELATQDSVDISVPMELLYGSQAHGAFKAS